MKIRPLKMFLFRFSITLQSIRRGAQKAKLEKPFYDALQKENRMNKYVGSPAGVFFRWTSSTKGFKTV